MKSITFILSLMTLTAFFGYMSFINASNHSVEEHHAHAHGHGHHAHAHSHAHHGNHN